jgi:hypothetical protein
MWLRPIDGYECARNADTGALLYRAIRGVLCVTEGVAPGSRRARSLRSKRAPTGSG